MCKLRGFSRRTAKHSTIDFKVTVWPVRDNLLLGIFAIPWQFGKASHQGVQSIYELDERTPYDMVTTV